MTNEFLVLLLDFSKKFLCFHFMSLGDLVLEFNKLYLIKELAHLFSASFIIGKMYIKIVQKVKVANGN